MYIVISYVAVEDILDQNQSRISLDSCQGIRQFLAFIASHKIQVTNDNESLYSALSLLAESKEYKERSLSKLLHCLFSELLNFLHSHLLPSLHIYFFSMSHLPLSINSLACSDLYLQLLCINILFYYSCFLQINCMRKMHFLSKISKQI